MLCCHFEGVLSRLRQRGIAPRCMGQRERERERERERGWVLLRTVGSLYVLRFSMRKLCPNFDREDGLETVLEVPIPEEMFGSPRTNSNHSHNQNNSNSWKTMKTWMRSYIDRSSSPLFGGSNTELQLLLGVIGAPLIPLPVQSDQSIDCSIKDHPIEASTAKYIVQQYIAATGGQKVLRSVKSMYAMGKVEMVASEFHTGNKIMKARNGGKRGEIGGFVLWQKNPDLWCLELVVSGCKISAGSDGKVAWRQTPWHQSHASRGPPRPLRRSLQGLDPQSTADLFTNAICIGEKTIKGDDCFILKLEADPSTLKARSNNNVEIIRHTVWGYFSQRTGLIIQFEDSHLLRIKGMGDESVYWETTMESQIEDYRHVDGINIAHGGRTDVSLFRFGESASKHTRTRMEESWKIEEVDFNIWGLSMDCFLPPGDLKKDQDGSDGVMNRIVLPMMAASRVPRIGSAKVAALDAGEDSEDDDEEEL